MLTHISFLRFRSKQTQAESPPLKSAKVGRCKPYIEHSNPVDFNALFEASTYELVRDTSQCYGNS